MELTRTPDVETPTNQFVPEGFHPTDTDALTALADQLLERDIVSVDELRKWLYDWSEISSVVSAEYARCFTAMNRDTKSEAFKERNLAYQRDVMPIAQRLDNKLTKKLLASPYIDSLGKAFDVMVRSARLEAKIFRDENADLGAEDNALAARYQEVQGNTLVKLGDEEMTVQQASARMADTDRAARKEAFLAIGDTALENVEVVDGIFDEMIDVRQRMAHNAGFDNFLDYRFAAMHRFDYTPTDCEAFHDGVEKVVVPAMREMMEFRREQLGVETLRPYDLDVSVFQSPPTKIFETQEQYVALLQRVFAAIDPTFERDFDILVRNDLLDLMSRPGKAPGGYNCGIDDMRLPFIFFNAVGRREDLRVMLHEGGHAFHSLASRGLPIAAYRHAPTEFCEVASMAMEMFGNERLREVMSDEEAREIEYAQLAGTISVFGSVARVDAFQHWIYKAGHPDAAAREAKWIELAERFTPDMTDWSGLEKYRGPQWQRIPHFFAHALYYIEYGIAQIGALQMWRKEKFDHAGTIASYRESLALGGSRPLPDLFNRAGIRFAMDAAVMNEVIPPVIERMKELRA